jgi:hypothetical protein
MRKLAVVTLLTDPAWHPLADVTLPTHRAYAMRIGAELIVLDRKIYPHPHYDKWQLAELFDNFERVLFLDADTIVRRDCPDLFICVEPDRVGGENELLTWPDHADGLREFVRRMGLPPLPGIPYYLNSGVLVASRCHRDLFRPPERVLADLAWPEQHHLNARLIGEHVPVCLLPQSFNDRHRGPGYHRTSFVLHYSLMGIGERIAAARADLAAWAAM